MKYFTIVFAAVLFLTACKPQPIPTVAPTETSTPTPTATPLPTATPTSTPDPLKEALLYSDDFSNDQSGWGADSNDQSKFYYSAGEYHIQASASTYYYYNTNHKSYTDGVLTVDLRQVSGDAKSTGGMVFWQYFNENDFYALTISGDGVYSIHRFLAGKFAGIKLPTSSPWLKTGSETNKITIAFKNGRSDFYFNDHFEYGFTDDSIPYGSVGVGAYPDQSSAVEIAFDNLAVYKYDLSNAYTPAEPVLTPTPAYTAISWQELIDFLAADHTNWHEYNLSTYNCVDFAVDLTTAAHQQNIQARIVGVDFVGQQTGHAFVVFDTSDRGDVFVEPQGDNTYSNVTVGNDLCDVWGKYECMGVIESIEYFGECDHTHSCTVELK